MKFVLAKNNSEIWKEAIFILAIQLPEHKQYRVASNEMPLNTIFLFESGN